MSTNAISAKMPDYTPEQIARIRGTFLWATRRSRPSSSTYERAILALNNVADDFEGAERGLISRTIHLLEQRSGAASDE